MAATDLFSAQLAAANTSPPTAASYSPGLPNAVMSPAGTSVADRSAAQKAAQAATDPSRLANLPVATQLGYKVEGFDPSNSKTWIPDPESARIIEDTVFGTGYHDASVDYLTKTFGPDYAQKLWGTPAGAASPTAATPAGAAPAGATPAGASPAPGAAVPGAAPTAAAQLPSAAAAAPTDLFASMPAGAGVGPTLSTVQPNETVQGQLKSLFDTGNPIMVQARENATRTAAGRGLQNSSIAAQAGEQALFSSAMPIAQQDAGTFATRALANQTAANQFGMSQKTFEQNAALAAQQYGFTSALSAQDAVQKLTQAALEGDIQAKLALQNYGFSQGLSAQESQQRLTEQAAKGDIDAAAALANFQYTASITELQGKIALNQSNVDSANRIIEMAKSGDIASRQMAEKFGFDMKLSAEENLAKLAQIAATGDVNAKLQLEQFNYQTLLNDQQAGAALTLEDERFQNNQSLMLAEYVQRGVLSEQEAKQRAAELNLSSANTIKQIQAQAEATGNVNWKQAATGIQNNYLIAITERQKSASQEIAAIYQTQGLSGAQQQAAVKNAYDRMNADIKSLQSYYSQSPLWDPNYGSTNKTTQPVTSPSTTAVNYPGPTTVTTNFNVQDWLANYRPKF